MVNITSNASALESSAIIVTANIINDLTDAAIEEPQVTYLSVQFKISYYYSYVISLQVRDMYLTAIDNLLAANMEELLLSQTQSNSSTMYVLSHCTLLL